MHANTKVKHNSILKDILVTNLTKAKSEK